MVARSGTARDARHELSPELRRPVVGSIHRRPCGFERLARPTANEGRLFDFPVAHHPSRRVIDDFFTHLLEGEVLSMRGPQES